MHVSEYELPWKRREIKMKLYTLINQALREFHIGIAVNFEFKNIH